MYDGIMLIARVVVVSMFTGLHQVGAAAVSGETYPTRPVRILTQEPGGGNDFAARIIAQGLAEIGRAHV